MSFLVFVTATGLTVRFIFVFIDKLNPVHPDLVFKARHRDTSNARASRHFVREDITTTGDILAHVKADLKDGFVETKLANGAMLNNEGWKTY
jgi:hypothetical protein